MFLTALSLTPPASLVRPIVAKMRDSGLDVALDTILTAPLVGRDICSSMDLPGVTLCSKIRCERDLMGIEFVEQSPQVVLVGDIGEESNDEALNRCFCFPPR